MRFFLAGIMQGSHTEKALHGQDYRRQIRELIEASFPDAQVYDPLADHARSLDYPQKKGRDVFFQHNYMCREVDVLVAFVPEASMGTAIEMWEAYEHGAAVVTISPMRHNWAVKFLSHERFDTVEEFTAAARDGRLAKRIAEVRAGGKRAAMEPAAE